MMLWMVATLIACVESDPWESLDASVARGQPGAYVGEAEILATGRFQGVPFARQRCSAEVVGQVDAAGVLTASLQCETGLLGVVDMSVWGASVGEGQLEGTLSGEALGEPFVSAWVGGYASPTSIFGESIGDEGAGSLSLRWDGGFTLDHEGSASFQ